MKTAIVIGGGPAGLMAADELSLAGAKVKVFEAKASMGRKFLMAGKSGLNLTKDEPLSDFMAHYSEAKAWLTPMIEQFGPGAVKNFANELDQEVFSGSSGRVFPRAMKASPMLRAWMVKLNQQEVEFQTKHRWSGWQDGALVFDTPSGQHQINADVTVFALGGKSWARLGSDGLWAALFEDRSIKTAPFGASNTAISIDWSAHMQPHFGTPLKAVSFSAGGFTSRGEAIISSKGLEGGGVYSVSRGVREGHPLTIDLKPDWTMAKIQDALEKPRGKSSLANHLRRVLKLQKHELELLNEWARPLPQKLNELASVIKGLNIPNATLRPIDEAISTSGGVMQDALNEHLMLHQIPGVFCAGEMLDWEAPTGGYLLTACFATGRTAGRGAAEYLGLTPAHAPV